MNPSEINPRVERPKRKKIQKPAPLPVDFLKLSSEPIKDKSSLIELKLPHGITLRIPLDVAR